MPVVMFADKLADYLEARGISNLYVGEFPVNDETGEITQTGVYMIPVGGKGEDAYLPVQEEAIDFWAVDPITKTAYNALEAVREFLSRNSNYDLGSSYIVYYSQDISGIMDMDRTKDGLKLFKVTINFQYRNKNIIS